MLAFGDVKSSAWKENSAICLYVKRCPSNKHTFKNVIDRYSQTFNSKS